MSWRRVAAWAVAAFLMAAAAPQVPGEYWATVARVIDGDTVRLDDGESVRLIGINTPETRHPTLGRQPGGPEATRALRELVDGRRVRLVFDVERRDRYRRLLAYLYRDDGLFVNAELVRLGYAQVMTIPPNVAHADLFLRLQREARDAERGLWGS